MANRLIKESCVETIDQIKYAASQNADRIELCSRLDVGGYTPNHKEVVHALKTSKIPTIIMIRRKSNNFVTNFIDLCLLKIDILKYRNSNIEGFVFGLLTKNNKIDLVNMQKLVKLSKNKYVVFHMAFDAIENKKEAIDQLVKLKIKRILTKGGSGVAINNVKTLNELQKYANNRIELIVGGKVTFKNYESIGLKTNIHQFHGTKIV